ncbi:Asp-tRNA(Asn)/Glu-tRNA(Gln) amidotransferase subunit GatC [Arcanobacterium phocae]|uniref:Aspartyl/glutamyl-tRNA(Asn/Gln) amidotransferase subunit C n=1 Tax=Arcanobacterium phocae TaxID=131112 RepID=A0A1H2LP40_9ACTO|nr:Asp-tRNA(Asn)/Glu-tRNA(Gln) amidotransferase subunit GatC [Arcanobacterium phocae]SDU77446.1 aspartyl/glutamyl-tRNA(Asn/Gln) amidotransferase subunit C [Arcanobacterium phocae]SDU82790.1 aspartyl/glutamyl-tRNA(Asn/Gln) amidotransferase subunit C [Arcanobacterium phocae]
MSTFSKEEVARLADLARISLSEQELEQFAAELEVINESVSRLKEVVSPDIPATSHPIPLTNVWRDDEVVPGLDRDEVLAMAPHAEDGKFGVPAILGEE